MNEIDTDARILWDYMQLHEKPTRADLILVLGSMDTRVAERGAELYHQGIAQTILVSGGLGRFTTGNFTKSEAETFADIMTGQGVPREVIYLEDKSSNTGENITFSHKLIQAKQLPHTSILLVQKPYMERRAYATFKKQWPDAGTKLHITSPQISFDDYFTPELAKDYVINVIVGDMQRIREYPKSGFQIPQDIPDEVWAAYERLVAAGYTQYLIPA